MESLIYTLINKSAATAAAQYITDEVVVMGVCVRVWGTTHVFRAPANKTQQ